MQIFSRQRIIGWLAATFLVALLCLSGTLGWYLVGDSTGHRSDVALAAPETPTPRPVLLPDLTMVPSPTVPRAPESMATRTPLALAPGKVEPAQVEATPPPAPQATPTVLEQLELTTIPPRDLFDLAIQFGKIPPDTPRVISEVDPGYTLGDRKTFTVSNVVTNRNFDVEATVRAQTEHATWWVADGASVNQEALEASALVFEEQTYPTNRAVFGSEWSPGIDGDPRIHIFLGSVPGVGGYFSSADAFPRSVNPYSNEKEIFYINTNNADPGTDYFDGILAHEFQHMIHWNIDRNEEIWVNEGLSELAAAINGFDVASGAGAFLRDPDIPLTHWPDQSHPHYGSAFLFLLYFYERFGEEAVTELVQTEADGARGFDELLDTRGSSFDDLFADWVVTNLVGDPELDDGRFAYHSESFPAPGVARTVRQYPVVERADVNQYGADYIRFEGGAGNSGTLEVRFTGNPTVSLLPAAPHSGDWMFWSNRGDDGVATLTREFDLSDLQRATLRFRTWYELEEDYDYAYVTVSTDGGERWQILRATSTTDSNPNGNSFGPAYTGRSGSGGGHSDRSEWIEETVDLSPFAGAKILLRFQVITDDALNENGFLVDDITIPQLGYWEDFEAGAGEWEAEGFARVDNTLPQQFIVQAVAEGPAGTRLFRLPLNEANRATLTIDDFGAGTDRLTLIVSGSTRFTTRMAGYTYAARLEP